MTKCKVIALANQKGGTAKTTTTLNLGIGLAHQWRKVLLVDADPQGDLTTALGWTDADDLPVTLATQMKKILQDEPFVYNEGILHHEEGVDIIPTNIELSGMEISLVNAMSREQTLKLYLADLKKDYDYIVVNDGSKDRTADICRSKGYEMLNLPVNLGLAGAFQAGLKYAYTKGYSYAIQFDADGQHRPEFIEPMLNRIKEGYDIVIGSRFINQKKEKSLRMIGSKMLTVAIKITTGKRVADPTSGMRMFSHKMIKEFAQNLNYGPEPDTVSYLLKNGAEISEVPVNMDERVAGESYLNLTNAAKYMVKMLISILFVQNFRKRG